MVTGTMSHAKCQTDGCRQRAVMWVKSPENKAKHVCWDCSQELIAVFGWEKKW